MKRKIAPTGKAQEVDMEVKNPERAALGIAEFARAIGCSTDTVRRQVAAGKLKAFRFSRRVLIPINELHRILTGVEPRQ